MYISPLLPCNVIMWSKSLQCIFLHCRGLKRRDVYFSAVTLLCYYVVYNAVMYISPLLPCNVITWSKSLQRIFLRCYLVTFLPGLKHSNSFIHFSPVPSKPL